MIVRDLIYVTGFFEQEALHGILDPELPYFTDFVPSERVYQYSDENIWSNSNVKQTFYYFVHEQKISVWCAIIATWTVGPIFS